MDALTITEIKQTKKERFALFCEGTFLFSLDSETFFAEQIAEGMTLSAEQLEALRLRSETRKAKDKALEYISLRDYAAGELYDKLCLKFDAPSAAAAVAEMQRLELLNDENFARHRVKYLMGQNKSRRFIAQHLRQKGVDAEVAAAALEEAYGGDENVEAALRVIEKSYASKLAQGKRENVMAALARRGFAYGDVRAALERFEADQQNT